MTHTYTYIYLCVYAAFRAAICAYMPGRHLKHPPPPGGQALACVSRAQAARDPPRVWMPHGSSVFREECWAERSTLRPPFCFFFLLVTGYEVCLLHPACLALNPSLRSTGKVRAERGIQGPFVFHGPQASRDIFSRLQPTASRTRGGGRTGTVEASSEQ